MRVPRQKTLEKGIGFRNIPKYEDFLKASFRYVRDENKK